MRITIDDLRAFLTVAKTAAANGLFITHPAELRIFTESISGG